MKYIYLGKLKLSKSHVYNRNTTVGELNRILDAINSAAHKLQEPKGYKEFDKFMKSSAVCSCCCHSDIHFFRTTEKGCITHRQHFDCVHCKDLI